MRLPEEVVTEIQEAANELEATLDRISVTQRPELHDALHAAHQATRVAERIAEELSRS